MGTPQQRGFDRPGPVAGENQAARRPARAFFETAAPLHAGRRSWLYRWVGIPSPDLVCDFRREVTLAGKRKLKRLWGAAEFLDRCQIAASQLPDPKDKKGLYTTNERRGSRHLTAIPRPTEAALQAA